jgi:cephalosporin-C deacetylase-like acetyl esterase
MERSYDLALPRTRSDEPMPLVLGYHGYASSAQELAWSWSGIALLDGFVTVFVQGSNLGGSTPAYFDIETGRASARRRRRVALSAGVTMS